LAAGTRLWSELSPESSYDRNGILKLLPSYPFPKIKKALNVFDQRNSENLRMIAVAILDAGTVQYYCKL
jgi:hypothetical protein